MDRIPQNMFNWKNSLSYNKINQMANNSNLEVVSDNLNLLNESYSSIASNYRLNINMLQFHYGKHTKLN